MRVACILAAALSAVVLTACGVEDEVADEPKAQATTIEVTDGETRIYKGIGYSFMYPAALQVAPGEFLADTGGELEEVFMWAGEIDFVAVILYPIRASVTADTIDEHRPSIDAFYEGLVEEAEGTIETGPIDVTIAGMPGLQYIGTTRTPLHSVARTKTTLLFNGRRELYVECQWTRKHAREIRQACDLVLGTLERN